MGRYMTEADKAGVIELIRAGHSARQVAAYSGWGRTSVQSVAKAMGWDWKTDGEIARVARTVSGPAPEPPGEGVEIQLQNLYERLAVDTLRRAQELLPAIEASTQRAIVFGILVDKSIALFTARGKGQPEGLLDAKGMIRELLDGLSIETLEDQDS